MDCVSQRTLFVTMLACWSPSGNWQLFGMTRNHSPKLRSYVRIMLSAQTRMGWIQMTIDISALLRQQERSGHKLASSAESVGRFWFRESSQVVIKGNFHSLVGTKAVGSSGNHSDFVVETLNGAIGDFSFGSKPIQDQRLMGA